jgi:DNA transformation protein and related proteins
MPVQPSFASYCSELLAPLGTVRSRRMFGGVGLYVDDVFVAILAEDTLYLKADAQTRPRFEAAGCQAFEYAANDRQASLNYWTVPPEAMDSPALMLPWARLAYEAALRARAPKTRKARAR